MHGVCTHMCPLDELRHGINARPHALEQWSAAELAQHGCSHAQRTDALLPPTNNRPSSSSSTARGAKSLAPSPLSEFLTPVAAYRRSASSVGTSAAQHHVRDLSALASSTRHLFHCVLPRLLVGVTFAAKYAYISDRCRQVKKELVVRSSFGSHPLECVRMLETMVRFHLVSASMRSSVGSHPLECVRMLETMVRFHVVSAYICFGADQTTFDRTMNEERTEDCLQELLACCQSRCTAELRRAWVARNLVSRLLCDRVVRCGVFSRSSRPSPRIRFQRLCLLRFVLGRPQCRSTPRCAGSIPLVRDLEQTTRTVDRPATDGGAGDASGARIELIRIHVCAFTSIATRRALLCRVSHRQLRALLLALQARVRSERCDALRSNRHVHPAAVSCTHQEGTCG
jgi:hypothetical protein